MALFILWKPIRLHSCSSDFPPCWPSYLFINDFHHEAIVISASCDGLRAHKIVIFHQDYEACKRLCFPRCYHFLMAIMAIHLKWPFQLNTCKIISQSEDFCIFTSTRIKVSDRLLMSWCWNYRVVCYHLSIHSFLTSPSGLGTEPPRSTQAGTGSPFTPFAFRGLWESLSLIKDFNKHIASFLTPLLNCSLLLEKVLFVSSL